MRNYETRQKPISQPRKPYTKMTFVLFIISVAIVSIYAGISIGSGQWIPAGWILTALVAILVAWCVYGATLLMVARDSRLLKVEMTQMSNTHKAEMDKLSKTHKSELAILNAKLCDAQKAAGSYAEILERFEILAPALESILGTVQGFSADQNAVCKALEDLVEGHRVTYGVSKAVYDHLGCKNLLDDVAQNPEAHNQAAVTTEPAPEEEE